MTTTRTNTINLDMPREAWSVIAAALVNHKSQLENKLLALSNQRVTGTGYYSDVNRRTLTDKAQGYRDAIAALDTALGQMGASL